MRDLRIWRATVSDLIPTHGGPNHNKSVVEGKVELWLQGHKRARVVGEVLMALAFIALLVAIWIAFARGLSS